MHGLRIGQKEKMSCCSSPLDTSRNTRFLPKIISWAFHQEDRTSFETPHINWNDDKSFYLYALDAVGNTT